MHTNITLYNDKYTMVVFGSDDQISATGEGTYDNFIEEINTLDEWFNSLKSRGTNFKVWDFRNDKETDSITKAKAEREEMFRLRDQALEGAKNSRELIEVAQSYSVPRLKIVMELRKRFGMEWSEAKELVA